MKHWEAFTQDSFAGWWAIREADSKNEVGSCDGGFDEGDARLMAAAPELLDALQDARFALYGNGPGNPKIDAAINKALGNP